MLSTSKKSVFKHLGLIVVLCVCLWVGWSDFELTKPEVTQEEIRESIRIYVRTAIQLAVQYFIPLAIVVYFGKKILGRSA